MGQNDGIGCPPGGGTQLTVLITGVTGFVGQHLLERLLAEGYSCRCLVRSLSIPGGLRQFEKVEYVQGDITRPDTLKGIGEGVDFVIHLAAMGHVSAISEEAFRAFVDINVNGTSNLIEALLPYKSSIKRFIHFSSTAAMGLIKTSLVDENTPCQPASPYQKSKYESELVALSFWEKDNFPVVVFRPCMVYGPGGQGEFLKMVRLMKKGFFPKVGRGQNLTPAVYVSDLVDATVKALEKSIPGETYLITSNTSFCLDDIRNTVVAELGVNPIYPYVPALMALFGAKLIEIVSQLMNKQPIVTYKNMDSTITDRFFDISKAKRELGYDPKVTLQEGISKTIRWYKREKLI